MTPLRRTLWLIVSLLGLCSCTYVEDKRIRELLVEKGFGTRAQGEATIENYVSGGDLVGFVVPPSVYLNPGMEQLFLLTQPQPVGIDGTILIPMIGKVQVLGLTEKELKNLVVSRLQPRFTFTLDITPRIVSVGKAFYVFGEAAPRRIPLVRADITFFEALSSIAMTPLANIGRVHLIRPDAQNPLVIVINFREMVLTGNMTYNIAIHENDIIYVPPTFFGQITRFIEKLLRPLAVIVNALLGVATLEATYDFLVGGSPFFLGGVRF